MQKSAWLLLGAVLFAALIFVFLFASCKSKGDKSTTGISGTASLSYDSFDGGGPTYTVTVDDPSILAYTSTRKYAKANHAELDGAGYTETITFKGEKPGQTTVTVSVRSPIGDNYDDRYDVTVDADLCVTLTKKEDEPTADPLQPVPTLVMVVNGVTFYPTLAQTTATDELVEKLSTEMLDLTLHENGGFEKTGELPWDLAQDDMTLTTEPGDILLYEGSQICLYYGENTWAFTRLAKIDGDVQQKFLQTLGDGDASVQMWVEWSE